MSKRGAFTLIEALVAIALVAVVLPVALAAISDGARTVERARRLDLARRVAETRLARMLADGSWLTAATAGDCDPAADGEDAAGLRWQLAVSTWRDPTVRRIQVVVGRDPAAGIETVAVETLAKPTSEAAP